MYSEYSPEQRKEIQEQIDEHWFRKNKIRDEIVWAIIKVNTTLSFGTIVALLSYRASANAPIKECQFHISAFLLVASLLLVTVFYFVNFLDLEMQLADFQKKVKKYYNDDKAVQWKNLWEGQESKGWYAIQFLAGVLFVFCVYGGMIFGVLSII
jgi:hypothetical protein